MSSSSWSDPGTSLQPTVFINYARSRGSDIAAALELATALRAHGLETWVAAERLSGEDVRVELIDAAIMQAGAFVLCAGGRALLDLGHHELEIAAERAAADPHFVVAVVRLRGYFPEVIADIPDVFRRAPQFDFSQGVTGAEPLVALLRTAGSYRDPTDAGVSTTGGSTESASPAVTREAGSSPPPGVGVVPFDLTPNAAGDVPSQRDLLGFAPLVRAIHALLDDPKTVLPLALAITAPWGAGKSSVMEQLKGLMDRVAEAGSKRSWRTVQFAAWKYERSERLWAALVKAIYDQAQRNMTAREKLAFRAHLEWRRRGPWNALSVTLTPLMGATAAVVIAIRADLSAAGNVAAGISALALFFGTVSRYGALITNPFRHAIEKHGKRPDYEAHLGFTAEADAEVSHLVSLLAPSDEHGLAVFVDDLDRCSSAHVVEVVEAMNQIFNAGPNRCAFVLGLDLGVVAANINVAYADTVAQLKRDHNSLGDNFGSEYLAKLVQLSVAVPKPDPAGMRRLMQEMVGEPSAVSGLPSEADVARATGRIRTEAPGDTLAGVEQAAALAAGTPIPVPAVEEAKRRELVRRLKDSPLVIEAEYAALAFLESNPRQVKRFHNAFRLQLYVASEDDRVTFQFTPDQLAALARWVALRLRWPLLADAIERDADLLHLLEARSNHESSEVDEQIASELTERYGVWLEDSAVASVMRESEPSRRPSALRLDSFARVA